MTLLIILGVVIFFAAQFLIGFLSKSKGSYFILPAIWLLTSIFLMSKTSSFAVRDFILAGIGFFVLLTFADRGQHFAQIRKDSPNVQL